MITNHTKPSWDQCCSCCPILERENKELKNKIKELELLTDEELILYKQVINTLKECDVKLSDDFTNKLKQRIKELDHGNVRHNN